MASISLIMARRAKRRPFSLLVVLLYNTIYAWRNYSPTQKYQKFIYTFFENFGFWIFLDLFID